MSDPATEPGVPAGGVTNEPAVSEKGVAAQVRKNLPAQLLRVAATPDRVILHLNRLLASPGGLSAFLSTFNYTLYLLAYLESKSVPLKIKLYQLLNRTKSTPALAAGDAPSHIAALGSLLSTTRTTLRLFGLLPMYAWLRQLSAGPKPGQDQVLYTTSLTQCLLYMAFQFLENVALLTDHKVLPASLTARWSSTPTPGGKTGTAKIYLWAYRAWMGGVVCDLVRLAREAQLERAQRFGRAKTGLGTISTADLREDEKFNKQWWAQTIVPLSWMPVAIQFSKESGIPGFNLGIMGACGALAGLGRTMDLWIATAE